MKLIDASHPFYRPAWRRVAVVAACFGWALIELIMGSPGWAILFGGVGLYAAYELFVANTGDTDEKDR